MTRRTTELLDANVLVALASPDHVHHAAATSWFTATDGRFATCPVTQMALVRVLIRLGTSTKLAVGALEAIVGHERHAFWPDDVAVDGAVLAGIFGHRQVTDAYLVHLARRHHGRLATFDQGLHATHPDHCELIASS